MLKWNECLGVQRGAERGFGANNFASDPVYIRNERDLSQWVHIDVLFQAYFNAKLISLQGPNHPTPTNFQISAKAMNVAVLQQVSAHNHAQPNGRETSYLLPQAFPEGSPTHPAYGAGPRRGRRRARVALLKAFCDEDEAFYSAGSSDLRGNRRSLPPTARAWSTTPDQISTR